MKKILSLILTLFCVLSLVGCGRSMDDMHHYGNNRYYHILHNLHS